MSIKLDYQTNNFAHGKSGMKYTSWEEFAFGLGYLANISHYNQYGGDIELHIEHNEEQGAVDKEGRIHFYGPVDRLKTYFSDWYNCCSAGNGNITKRINSTPYMLSLVNDFNFVRISYSGRTTEDIYPPQGDGVGVWKILSDFLNSKGLNVNLCQKCFWEGWNL